MAEYIEREAAIDSTYALHFKDLIQEALRNLPAADVRPAVRGKWKKGTGENGVTTSLFCSVCHYENRHWHEWNFCPNCGAMMEANDEKT